MEKYDWVYYKDNFIEKFNSLLDIKYNDVPKSKRRKKFFDEYRTRYYSDIEKTAKNWFRKDYITREIPTMAILINICNLLHSDFDYFLTPQHEYNSDVLIAKNTTGLTEKSIENLFNVKQTSDVQDPIILSLNYLLEDNFQKGYNLLLLIYRYLFGNYDRTLDGSESIKFADKTGIACNGVEIPISELNDLFMPMIQGQLQRIKNDIVNQPEKWNNYGKYIPTEKEYNELSKIKEFQNKHAEKMLEKYKNNPAKQKYWHSIIDENKLDLEKMRNLIAKNNQKGSD